MSKEKVKVKDHGSLVEREKEGTLETTTSKKFGPTLISHVLILKIFLKFNPISEIRVGHLSLVSKKIMI